MTKPRVYWAVFGPSCMATFFRLQSTKRAALREIEKLFGSHAHEAVYKVRRVEVREVTATPTTAEPQDAGQKP